MFKRTFRNRSLLTLPDLNSIARETRLLVRQSAKFTPSAFLQTLLSSVVTGLASLNQLADCLKGHTHQAMSRQSFHERLNQNSIAFLLSVLHEIIQQRFHQTLTMLTAMIAHQLGTRAAIQIASAIGRAKVSYEKLYENTRRTPDQSAGYRRANQF